MSTMFNSKLARNLLLGAATLSMPYVAWATTVDEFAKMDAATSGYDLYKQVVAKWLEKAGVQRDPALAEKLRAYFLTPEPGRHFSRGYFEFLATVDAIEAKDSRYRAADAERLIDYLVTDHEKDGFARLGVPVPHVLLSEVPANGTPAPASN